MKKYILFRHIILIVFIFLLGIFLIGCGKKNNSTKRTVIQDTKEDGDFKLVKINNKWYIGGLVDVEKEEIIIPSTLNVYGIWEKAFCDKEKIDSWVYGKEYNSTLRKVTIEKELKRINDYAFYNCNVLSEIILPKTVTEIGDCAFYNCIELKKVDISNIKKIGDSSFTYSLIDELTFSKSIEKIGHSAFNGCPNIKEVDLSNCLKLTSIEGWCFSNCSNLNKVLLPKNIKTIERQAFSFCRSLKKIDLPKNINIIDREAFWITGLEEIIIPEKVKVIGVNAFESTNISKIVILGKVKKIASNAFCYFIINPNLKIYYKGSLDDWNETTFFYVIGEPSGDREKVDLKHEDINKVDKLFYSEKKPTDTSLKYWHFVDGEAVPWDE